MIAALLLAPAALVLIWLWRHPSHDLDPYELDEYELRASGGRALARRHEGDQP